MDASLFLLAILLCVVFRFRVSNYPFVTFFFIILFDPIQEFLGILLQYKFPVVGLSQCKKNYLLFVKLFIDINGI